MASKRKIKARSCQRRLCGNSGQGFFLVAKSRIDLVELKFESKTSTDKLQGCFGLHCVPREREAVLFQFDLTIRVDERFCLQVVAISLMWQTIKQLALLRTKGSFLQGRSRLADSLYSNLLISAAIALSYCMEVSNL